MAVPSDDVFARTMSAEMLADSDRRAEELLHQAGVRQSSDNPEHHVRVVEVVPKPTCRPDH
jgi:hypothetical protein